MPTLTAPQLALLRSSPQTSNWYCIPIPPVTVFAAQINGSPGVGAVVIPYDTVSFGAFGDVKVGMTLWVGTTPDSSDIAIIRIRLVASASNLYVAWNSDIAWADNLYLTVKKQYLPWSVRQRIVPPTIYKDYNIAYTDQTNLWPPVAMMGDNVCKLWSGNPTTVYFDGSESYAVANGATITGYAWDFDDGTNSAVATPGYHPYTAAGTYYPTLTVTDSNGKTHLTRRIVSLPDPATVYTVNFEQTELNAAIDDGWKAKARVFDPNANTANFPERAPCFIISVDTYGGVAGSVGYPLDRENIVMFGYIVEDSVAVQPEYNEITFDIESIAGVMGKADSTPVFLSDSTNPAGNPDAWAWGKNLNVFRGLVFLLKFHSTVMDIADVQLYNDTTVTKMVDYPQDNLWNMLVQFGKGKRLMHSGVTRTGRVIVGRDPNLTPVASRGAFTTICQLVDGDWKEQVTIPQKPYPITSFCCISGLVYDGNPAHEPNPVFGMSPGRPPKEYGSEKEMQFLKLVDQTECNALAGLIVGTDNMPFGDIVIPLRGNWTRAFDPARQEYVQAPAGGFSTKRGNLLFASLLIVRKVTIKFDWAAGMMQPTLTCEYYSYPEIGVNGDCWPPDAPPPPRVIIPPIIPPLPPSLGQPPPVQGAHSNSCSSGTSVTALSWTYSGAGTPTYYIERSLLSTSGYSVIGTTGSTSYNDSTVVPGRTYYYRIRGNIGGYYTAYSNVISQAAAFCVPTLSLSILNCVTAHLTWTNVSGETTFQIERSVVSGSGFVLVGTVGMDVLSYDDTPAPRGVYYYRVRAQNAYASSAYSNEVSETLGYEAWHPHVVLATASHVYEFASATFGIGYFPTPTDITGNITGTIIGCKFYGGNLLVLTSTNIWRRTTGSTWVASTTASDWAANSSLWSFAWWNEDGTGTHGHAVWGNRSFEHPGAFPCSTPHTGDSLNALIHWTYQASAQYMQLIGNQVVADSRTGTSLTDCSLKDNGAWSTPVTAGEPDSYGFIADTVQPNVWDQGFVALHAPSWQYHFSPYNTENLHDFNLDNGLGGNNLYYDGVDISSTTWNQIPSHFTDFGGHVWMWGGNGTNNHLQRDDGAGMVEKLNQDIPNRPFAISVPPGGTLVRALLYAGGMDKSIDYGANWTSHPSFAGAAGIYVTEAEVDRIYGISEETVWWGTHFGLRVSLWLSSNDGANWCKVWSAPVEQGTPLGIWADTSS